MANRLGCSTITLGGLLPDKLRAIRDAGFGATEILTRDVFESIAGVEIAIGALAESGLATACLQLLRDHEGAPAHLRPLKRKIAETVFGMASLVNTATVILCCNVDPASSGDTGMLRDDLFQLGELAAAHGVRVAYEPLCWGRWMGDYRDAWKLVRDVNHPAIGMMLDSAHIGGIGLSFEAVDEIDPAKIFLVELNDLPTTNLPAPEVSRFYRLMPGEGVMDLADFVGRLERNGFTGPYSLEVLSTHYRSLPPAECARHAFQALARLMAPFGLVASH